MPPDFPKSTIELLSKRSAFYCSNPTCQILTIGPNTDSSKSTTLGEAAHIYGARPHSARYEATMNDHTRAEITNAIWLCRNCHKRIDRDPQEYDASILYSWRKKHEEWVLDKLGKRHPVIITETDSAHKITGYPDIIQRIIIDKPHAWEWRLTAEFLRYLNTPVLRRLDDLNNNMYSLPLQHIADDIAVPWIQEQINEMSQLLAPFVGVLDNLNLAWGPPGTSGNVTEIEHTCVLMRDALSRIVDNEEELKFVAVSDDFQPVIDLLRGALGSQTKGIADLPKDLDDMVELSKSDHEGTKENPLIVRKTIDFELPSNFAKDFSKALNKFEKALETDAAQPGCLGNSIAGIFVIIFLAWIFG